MTSFDKKIRQKGWESSGSYKEYRGDINRFLGSDGKPRPLPARKSQWKCKKNRGDHTLVYVVPNGRPNHNDPDKLQYWANMYSEAECALRLAENRGYGGWMKPRKVFRCSACGKMQTFDIKKPA